MKHRTGTVYKICCSLFMLLTLVMFTGCGNDVETVPEPDPSGKDFSEYKTPGSMEKAYDYSFFFLPGQDKKGQAYVGDTISRDVLGTRNAGWAMMIQIRNPAIAHRDTGMEHSGYTPDALIEDLAEIPSLLKR